VKKLLGVLIIAMFVLSSCATKEVVVVKEEMAKPAMSADADKSADCKSMAKEHVCSDSCMAEWKAAHMAKMGADHVCTEACDHSKEMMAMAHVCSEECSAECKTVHMAKMGADHVCTEACAEECAAKKAECAAKKAECAKGEKAEDMEVKDEGKE